MKLFKEFRNAVTGEHLFNYQIYTFFLPVFWITSVLTNVRNASWLNLFNWTIANIIAIGLGLLVILLADKLIFRNRIKKPANLIGVLLVGLLVGAVKGSATTYLAYLFGSESNLDSVVSRTIQAAILGLVTLPALAIVSATQARFQIERDALVAERVRIAADTIRPDMNDLNELKEVFDQMLSGMTEDKPLPPLLHEVVRQKLRPFTHRLWELENSKQSDYSLRSLLRIAILDHPFVALPVALIIGLGSFFPYLQTTNISEAVPRTAVTMTTIFFTYLIAQRLKQKTFTGAVLYFLAVHAFIAVTIVLISAAMFGRFANLPEISSLIILFIWITQTAFMTSFIKGVMVTRSEIREALEKHSDKIGVDSEVLKVRTQITKRSLANHLHGSVQNKLLLLALKLERGDALETREELMKIRELLDIEIGSPEDSVSKQLEGLVNRWQGFVEIQLSVTGTLPENTEIPKVASEAVNNSVRHGLAHRIWIILDCKPGEIEMTVDDDGIGPRIGKSGLGTKYFNTVAGNSWTLVQRETGGSSLKLSIPEIG